jgi:hypothetical protein
MAAAASAAQRSTHERSSPCCLIPQNSQGKSLTDLLLGHTPRPQPLGDVGVAGHRTMLVHLERALMIRPGALSTALSVADRLGRAHRTHRDPGRFAIVRDVKVVEFVRLSVQVENRSRGIEAQVCRPGLMRHAKSSLDRLSGAAH